MPKSSGAAGRPPITSRVELEAAALNLFAARGFDGVTVDDIAAAAGVSRRTFFRYFPSKNDVVWGAFDELLEAMEGWLAEVPASTPLPDAVADAVVRFNSLPQAAVPAHRQRMALILRVPTLQAHGTLRYADWRDVIARFVARRLALPEDAPLPQLIGHVSLGVAMAAYEQWLATPDADLGAVLQESFIHLRMAFSGLHGNGGSLGERHSPELSARSPLLLVPLGSTEQHGPHLPLDTDTRLAKALAEAAAARLVCGDDPVDALVAPPLAYGSSGEHAGFPGTVSIGQAALEAVVVELARSADQFAGIVLVCGHGGNAEPVRRAVETVRAERRNVTAWFPSVPDGDAHAGRTETSLLLHVAPDVVRLDAAEPGATTPIRELLPRLRDSGVAAVSPNGILGDPAGASAAEGQRIFDALVANLVATSHVTATASSP